MPKSRAGARRESVRHGSYRRRLKFESLEDRRLLAVNIDPDGATGNAALISNVVGFDWAIGSTYMETVNSGRTTVAGGGASPEVRTLLNATLATFLLTNNQVAAVPTGEYTLVMSFGQTIGAAAGTTTSLTVLPNGTSPNFFEVYFDPVADANPTTGTGFNDGTLVLSGTITSGSSSFVTSAAAATALDTAGADDYPGVQTLALQNGDLRVVVNETTTNNTFFNKNLSTIDFVSTLQLPFNAIDPSDAFVIAPNGVAPTTTNAAGQDRVGAAVAGQGVGQVNLGAPAGPGGPDAIFAADGNSANLQAVGTINGRKFNDLNADGDSENGNDPGLANFVIQAYNDANNNDLLDQAEFDAGTVATATTGATGTYSLTLDPGNYIVVEVQQPNFSQTSPGTGVLATGLTTPGTTLGANGYAITLASDTDLQNNDFGNAQNGTIAGLKFNDLNGDGDNESGGDPGLPNFVVNAYQDLNGNGTLEQNEFDAGTTSTATTAANGSYTLNLAAGNYIVVEVQQPNFSQTLPTTNVIAAGVTTPGVTLGSNGYAVALTSGAALTGRDFGNAQQGSITGLKFNDINGDGDNENGGDPGLVNVNVRAYLDANGNGLLDQAEFNGNFTGVQTAADGTFTIGVTPGRYIVVEVLPANSTQTSPVTSVLAGGLNTGGVTLGPRGYVSTVVSGATVANNNFGNALNATITGLKFTDVNGDGDNENGGDPGLANFQIRAYPDVDGDGVLDQNEFTGVTPTTATTAADGTFSMTLVPGNYIFVEVQQAGFNQTAPVTGVLVAGLNTAGITLGANGYAQTITSGQTVTNINFGNAQQATVSGQKFHDLNADGDNENGADPGLANWVINAYVDTDADGVLDQNELVSPPAATATTNAGGTYSLSVAPGSYIILEVLQNEWSQTFPGTDVIANGVNLGGLTLGQNGYALTLTSGQTSANNNFGNVLPASIHGHKFEDLDGDGIEDAGEPRLNGWTIFLDADNDGVLDAGEVSVVTANQDLNGNATIETNEMGLYSFENLTPGNYFVREVLQTDWQQTTTNPAVVALQSGQEYVALAGQAAIPNGSSRQEVVQADLRFGNFLPGSIHGHKFLDANNNGVEDAGDSRLNGWVIFLDTNDNGTLDTGETSTTTANIDLNGDTAITADEMGLYAFTNLQPGTYRVREVPQAGFNQTTTNPVVEVRSRQEFVAAAGQAMLPTGSPRQEVPLTTLAFGNARDIGSIRGNKFNDLDRDGTQDANELRLNGWTIYLDLDNDGVLDANEPRQVTADNDLDGNGTITPNEVGLYAFDNLDPGTYVIREVPQVGFEQITANPVQVVLAGNQIRVASLDQAGVPNPQTDPRVVLDPKLSIGNAAERGSITGHKFQDTDRDGMEDAGEPRLNGWTIYIDTNNNGLLDANEPRQVTASRDLNNDGDATDANEIGLFTFSDLDPGTYVIREVVQDGFVQTTMAAVSITVTGSQRVVAALAEAQVPDPINDPRVVVNMHLAIGNVPELGSISGHKFLDTNNNMVQDAGETRLNGWTIYLDLNDNGIADANEPTSVTTSFDLNGDGFFQPNEVGLYRFEDLATGTYIVREVVHSGFQRTTPDGVMVTITGNQRHVAIREQARVPNPATDQRIVENAWLAIGNRPEPGSIHGHKFIDNNRNGMEDTGDVRANGWTIYLDLDNDGVLDSGEPLMVTQSMDLNGDGDTTDANETGLYWFKELQPGTYFVREVPQPGFDQSTTNPTQVVLVGNQKHVSTLAEAQVDGAATDPRVIVDKYLAIGNSPQLGSIHGHKFLDANRNAVEDAGDTRLNGWTIYLDLDNDGTLDQGEPFQVTQSFDLNGDGTIQAEETGLYSFVDLLPGTYVVREVVQANFQQTTQVTTVMLTGNQIYAATLAEARVPNAATDPRVAVNAWLAIGNAPKLPSIHGHKFNDFNGDGIQQPTEPRLNGWTFYLDLNNSGTLDAGEPVSVTQSMDLNGDGDTTDANESGLYWFEDLQPGAYVLREVVQTNFRATTDIPVTLVLTGNQSHVASPEQAKVPNPTSDPSVIVNAKLAVGNTNNRGEIHGHKTEDVGGGRLDGWVIFLDQNNNGVLDAGERSTVTSSTDIDQNGSIDPNERGRYSFKNLEPGTYFVREVLRAGFIQRSTNPAPITITGNQVFVSSVGEGNFATGDTRTEVVIPQLEFRNTTLPGSIRGHKFEDIDGDGIEDPGEPRLNGWVFFLDANNNGTLDAGERSTTTASIDFNGNGMFEANEVGVYAFDDLQPGTYTVREVLQTNFFQRTPNPPTLIITTNEVFVSTAGQGPLVAGDPRTENVIVELGFGNQRDPASIHGVKFFDVNANGIFDAQIDTRQAGVTFTLTGTDAFGNAVNRTAVTDANGLFGFEGLTAGTFTVTEVVPAGSMPTTGAVARTYALRAFEEIVAFAGQANIPAGDQRFETILANPNAAMNSLNRPSLFWGNRGGSIRFFKRDEVGALLGGAEFTLTLTHTFDTTTGNLVPVLPTSWTIRDNNTVGTTTTFADSDPTLGEFTVGLPFLGRYQLRETTPLPGYDGDFFVETLNVTPTTPNVTATHTYVNVLRKRGTLGSNVYARMLALEELANPQPPNPLQVSQRGATANNTSAQTTGVRTARANLPIGDRLESESIVAEVCELENDVAGATVHNVIASSTVVPETLLSDICFADEVEQPTAPSAAATVSPAPITARPEPVPTVPSLRSVLGSTMTSELELLIEELARDQN